MTEVVIMGALIMERKWKLTKETWTNLLGCMAFKEYLGRLWTLLFTEISRIVHTYLNSHTWSALSLTSQSMPSYDLPRIDSLNLLTACPLLPSSIQLIVKYMQPF